MPAGHGQSLTSLVVIQGDGCDAQVTLIPIVGVILCKKAELLSNGQDPQAYCPRTEEKLAKRETSSHQLGSYVAGIGMEGPDTA